MMGVNLTSGGSLQWWVDSVLQGLRGVSAKNRYDAATAEATEVPAGSNGLIFLPYLNGERTPHADPRARGSFVGLNLTHTRGHLTRSVMEGITLALRDSLEIIQSLDVPVRQIRASGGGSTNPFWRQMQADVFGKKITTLEVEQGPAYGVALLAMVGDGAFRSIEQACKATITVADETPPERSAVKRYDRIFPIYQDLYRQLADSMHALAEIQSGG
jgi:xylulokinase